MAGTKSTKKEQEEIKTAIRDLYQDGKTRHSQICRYMTEKFNLSDRQIERYIAEINEEIKEQGQFQSEFTRRILLDRYDDLYTEAKEKGDIRTCVWINSKIADIGVMKYEAKQLISPEIVELINTLKSIK